MRSIIAHQRHLSADPTAITRQRQKPIAVTHGLSESHPEWGQFPGEFHTSSRFALLHGIRFHKSRVIRAGTTGVVASRPCSPGGCAALLAIEDDINTLVLPGFV